MMWTRVSLRNRDNNPRIGGNVTVCVKKVIVRLIKDIAALTVLLLFYIKLVNRPF